MKYAIGDLHFDHARVIDLDSRPFENVEAMNAAMIANWRSVVQPKDEVYILGDLSLSGGARTSQILEQLPGRKVLVRGNHDAYLKDPDFDRSVFERVCEMTSFKEHFLRYQLCHYPLLEYEGMFRNQRLLYGHVHNTRKAYFARLMNPNAVNVSASEINYTPISIDQIEARITLQWQEKVAEVGHMVNELAGRQLAPTRFTTSNEPLLGFDQETCKWLVTEFVEMLLRDSLVPFPDAVLDIVPAAELAAAQKRVGSLS